MLRFLRNLFVAAPKIVDDVHYVPPGAYTAVLLKESGQRGRFYFQKRTRKEKIFYGRLAMFGGHREGEETPEECALRELKEELGVDFAAAELVKIAAINTFDDKCHGAIGQIFLIDDLDPKRVDPRKVNIEGRLLRLGERNLRAHWRRFTPATSFAVLQYFVYKACLDADAKDSK